MEITDVMVKIMADPLKNISEMEYLRRVGVRAIINDGKIAGWEIERGQE